MLSHGPPPVVSQRASVYHISGGSTQEALMERGRQHGRAMVPD